MQTNYDDQIINNLELDYLKIPFVHQNIQTIMQFPGWQFALSKTQTCPTDHSSPELVLREHASYRNRNWHWNQLKCVVLFPHWFYSTYSYAKDPVQ